MAVVQTIPSPYRLAEHMGAGKIIQARDSSISFVSKIKSQVVARSQLLLLDEPLSNLDSDLKSILLEELSVLQRRLKLTTLYVTHDKLEAATFADIVVKMKSGRIDESNLTLMQGVR